MSVRSQREGSVLIDECSQAHTQLAVKVCQTRRGDRSDQVVGKAQLEIALSALAHLEGRAKQCDQQAKRQIERAQSEADLARRRYHAVDPENRLVARSLERDGNEKRAEVDRLEREEQTQPAPDAQRLSAEQREQIRALTQDLPALWDAPTTTNAQRKPLVRGLIKDVTRARRGDLMVIDSRWQTEARSSLSIPRLKKSWELRQTQPEAMACLLQWAPTHSDASLARLLNEAGYRAGGGGVCSAKKVHSLRYGYQMEAGCPQARQRVPPGNGVMDATQHELRPSCSTSMLQRLRRGVKPGVWSVCKPLPMDHAGLRSPQNASRSFASRRNNTGNLVRLENRNRTWERSTRRVGWGFWFTPLATIGIPNIAGKERQ
jgi:hypothetical protein